MLIAGIVAGVPCVASPIPRLVAVEVIELPLTAFGHRPVIAMMRVIAVVHMAIEPFVAAIPWPCSKEDPAGKPVRSVIAVGGTLIGFIVEVPVWAFRCHANADTNLRASLRCATDQRNAESCKSKNFTVGHSFSFNLLGPRSMRRFVSPAISVPLAHSSVRSIQTKVHAARLPGEDQAPNR